MGGVTDARRRPELEPVMGYFLDTFALRTAPTAETPFAQYLGEVRDSVLGALAAVDVPFDQVVQAVQPTRDRSHHPIFQAFFSIEPPVAPFREGWDLTQMDVAVGAAKFDLYLELDERPDHMAARLMYSTDLFDAATIERMAAHWRVLLEAVCRDATEPLGDLPVLTAAEVAQLTAPGSWNDTARPFPQGPVHDLLAGQARQAPERIAAVFGDSSATYKQLTARAETLGAELEAVGAARGSIVAVLLPRSLDLLAALIAVMRTGAAYLPLDPDTPQARIALRPGRRPADRAPYHDHARRGASFHHSPCARHRPRAWPAWRGHSEHGRGRAAILAAGLPTFGGPGPPPPTSPTSSIPPAQPAAPRRSRLPTRALSIFLPQSRTSRASAPTTSCSLSPRSPSTSPRSNCFCRF